jgi:hypothetical protein
VANTLNNFSVTITAKLNIQQIQKGDTIPILKFHLLATSLTQKPSGYDTMTCNILKTCAYE